MEDRLLKSIGYLHWKNWSSLCRSIGTRSNTTSDGVKNALYSIQNGLMEATVQQDAPGQAVESIRLTIKATQGEKITDMIIPTLLVTKDNVDVAFANITVPED